MRDQDRWLKYVLVACLSFYVGSLIPPRPRAELVSSPEKAEAPCPTCKVKPAVFQKPPKAEPPREFVEVDIRVSDIPCLEF